MRVIDEIADKCSERMERFLSSDVVVLDKFSYDKLCSEFSIVITKVHVDEILNIVVVDSETTIVEVGKAVKGVK